MSSKTLDAPPSPARAGVQHARLLADRVHLPLAGLLTAFLAFHAGGYFPGATGIAAIAVGVALLLRITLADEPFAGWSRAAAAAALGGAGFACWLLVSAAWSHSAGRSLVEFDRALLYVLALTFYATVPRRPGALTAVLRWVLGALVAVCVAGLASRLAPDLAPISGRFVAERLSFPLTYWNAMGVATALATVLAVHHASGEQEPLWMRCAAAAALPATATALYFTFSRGGIGLCAIGLLGYAALTRSRALIACALAAGPPVAVAIVAAYGADALSTAHYATGAGPGQGHRVAAIVAVACVAAGVLRLALARLEPRIARIPSPWPRALAARLGVVAVVAAALVAGAVAIDAPARVRHAAHTFETGDFVRDTGDARDRLLESHSNGRVVIWRAAADSWTAHPLRGTGAGTFPLDWDQRRPYFLVVHDGHSLYLETLGELGLVGLALLLVLVLVPLGAALRGALARRPDRHACAAVAATGLALLLHAGVDWDWEMPALFVWLFAASGVALAAPAGAARRAPVPARLARVVAGLACLLLLVTPWLVVRSQGELDAAARAFGRGDCTGAVASALAARDTLSVRPEPFELIGYCDLQAGAYGLGLRAMQAAHARDPLNWQYAYEVAVAQAMAGQDPRAAAAEAVRENPREAIARALQRGLASANGRKRFEVAARAPVPSD